MKISKKDMAIDEIVKSITTGKVSPGNALMARNIPLGTVTTTEIFRLLAEHGIIKLQDNNTYAFSDKCYENSQKLYCEKIYDLAARINALMKIADISPDYVISLFTEDKGQERR